MIDAVGMAELVHGRDATSLDLVTDAIGPIERINALLNAVVRPLFDEVRQAAAAVPTDAPLAGVPFLLKDLLAEQAKREEGVEHERGSLTRGPTPGWARYELRTPCEDVNPG